MITFLVDGYNLLNACGVEAAPGPPGTPELDRARQGLLDFLAEVLTAEEVSRTMLVFDAHGPRWKRPVEESYRGLTVRFAVQYPDADTLLEQLIARHTAPRQLTVVSSDHRVQRAARRRRAKFIDSDDWYAALCRRLRNRSGEGREVVRDTNDRLDAADVQDWLRTFGLSKVEAETPIAAERGARSASREAHSERGRRPPKERREPGADRKPGRESPRTGSRNDAPTTSVRKEGDVPGDDAGESGPSILGQSAADFGLSEKDLQKPIEAWESEEGPRSEKPCSSRKRRRPPRR
ncbi:MAG: hypothetical protein GYA33_05970 [Thermogutta sp.]|nr:hypothetical protein [Thermogutta sp.]